MSQVSPWRDVLGRFVLGRFAPTRFAPGSAVQGLKAFARRIVGREMPVHALEAAIAHATRMRARIQLPLEHLRFALWASSQGIPADNLEVPASFTLGEERVRALTAQLRLFGRLRERVQAVLALADSADAELEVAEELLVYLKSGGKGEVRRAFPREVAMLYAFFPHARDMFWEFPLFAPLFERDMARPAVQDAGGVPLRFRDYLETPEAAPAMLECDGTCTYCTHRALPPQVGVYGVEVLDPARPEHVYQALKPPMLLVEVGLHGVPLIDPDSGPMLATVAAMRFQLAKATGYVACPVTFKDNLALRPNGFRILVRGQEVASGEFLMGYSLAVPYGRVADGRIPHGFAQDFPAFHDPEESLEAYWVAGPEIRRAQRFGYRLLSPEEVVVRHLELVLRKYAYELFTLEELKWLLDELHSTDPLLVEALPETLTLLELHRVIQHLMREGVSLRPLQDVLRRLLDFGKLTHDPVMLAEMVRKAMAS